MRFVQYDESPMLAQAVVEEWTIIGTYEKVFKHRVIRQENLRRGLTHVFAEDYLPRQSVLPLGPPLSIPVVYILWCLSGILAERKAEIGSRVCQCLANITQPLSLVVCQGIHWINYHGADARLRNDSGAMLGEQVEEDGIDEALGLAACRARRHYYVSVVIKDFANGVLLMGVKHWSAL